MRGGKISQDDRRLRIPAWHVKTGKELHLRSARERRIWARSAPNVRTGIWRDHLSPVIRLTDRSQAGDRRELPIEYTLFPRLILFASLLACASHTVRQTFAIAEASRFAEPIAQKRSHCIRSPGVSNGAHEFANGRKVGQPH